YIPLTLREDSATCSGQCTFETRRERTNAKPTPFSFFSHPFKPPKSRASARFALWEVWNPLRPKTGGDWRTSSNRRCRDKSPCRVLRQKSKNGWRKPATKRRAPSDPTETDRLSPSNPTRSRLNKRVKLVRYMSDTSSGASWK